MSGRRTGVVLRDEGSSLTVDLGGEEVSCVLRKSLRKQAGRRRKAVVVGDRVEVEFSAEGAAICAVAERRTHLSRPDPGDPRREQILVANIDAVLIVASAREPDFAPALIDRFLVAAEARGLSAAIVLNKIDLDPERRARPTLETYRELGYPMVETSVRTAEGLDQVRALLAQRTTTMVGHSGVGKSSLANSLDESLRLRTGEVHGASGRGTHTTTTVSLLRLPWGGYLVDTPGIREFGLWGLAPGDLGPCFPEIARHQPGCRFNDCLHESEPGCAVKEALSRGEIAGWRFDSYRKLLAALREERSAQDG